MFFEGELLSIGIECGKNTETNNKGNRVVDKYKVTKI